VELLPPPDESLPEVSPVELLPRPEDEPEEDEPDPGSPFPHAYASGAPSRSSEAVSSIAMASIRGCFIRFSPANSGRRPWVAARVAAGARLHGTTTGTAHPEDSDCKQFREHQQRSGHKGREDPT